MSRGVLRVAPDGWEFCGMLNGTHTVNLEGEIEPFDYRDCLTRCDHDIVRLAEALIQLDEKVIRRIGSSPLPTVEQGEGQS